MITPVKNQVPPPPIHACKHTQSCDYVFIGSHVIVKGSHTKRSDTALYPQHVLANVIMVLNLKHVQH